MEMVAGTHAPGSRRGLRSRGRFRERKAARLAVRALVKRLRSETVSECNAEFNVGQRSACGATHGATDAQQVDVPTHDEHGVRNTHLSRITRNCPVCPAEAAHVSGQPPWPGGYSACWRDFQMLIPAPPVRKVTLCFPALGSA